MAKQNPNPLTKEKLKSGVVIARWCCITERAGYEYKISGDKDRGFHAYIDNDYQFGIEILGENCLELYAKVSDMVFKYSCLIGQFTIIKESTEESEVKS